MSRDKKISISKLIREHLGLTITVGLLLVVISFGSVAFAYLLMDLLQIKGATNVGFILMQKAAILAVIAIAYSVLRYISAKLQARLVKTWVLESKDLISDKIINMDYFDVSHTPAGEFVSWYANDIDKIIENYFTPFFSVISNATLSVFAITAIFSINVLLGFCTLGLLLLMMIFPMFAGRQVSIATNDLSKKQESYMESLSGTIMGYEQCKNFGAFGWMRSRIAASNVMVEESRYTYQKKYAVVQNGMIFLNNSSQLILIALSVYLIHKGVVGLGVVLSIVTLANNFFNSTMGLLETSVLFSSVKGILEKLTVQDKKNENVYDQELYNIEVKGGKAVLGDREIELQNVEIEKNDKCLILGASGKGKSTLLKLILGKIQSYTGLVKVNDHTIENLLGGDFSDCITYLTQEPYIFNASIRDNITLGKTYSDDELWLALKKAKIDQFVKDLPEGLDTNIESMGKNVSGGEKQRIVLSRGLVRKNSVLILDEALSAVDKETADEIMDGLVNQLEITLLMISHHLGMGEETKFNKVIRF